MTRAGIEKQIPVKIDTSAIAESVQATTLTDSLEELTKLKKTAVDIIEKIFQRLNDENVVQKMMLVHKQKQTAENVFEESKEEYVELFKEIAVANDNIDSLLETIDKNNQVFQLFKADKLKPNPENEKFFSELQNKISKFHTLVSAMERGYQFYNQFFFKVADLQSRITDFLISRDLEKQDLLRYLVQTGNVPNTTPQSGFEQGGNYQGGSGQGGNYPMGFN